jgi:hypothetical protein
VAALRAADGSAGTARRVLIDVGCTWSASRTTGRSARANLAIDAVERGEIADAKSILGLLWLDRLRRGDGG